MIELQEIAPSETRQTFGGDTLNTAIYCARLEKELPLNVDYVTALGTDTFSRKMIRFWEKEGVGSELVLMQEGESVLQMLKRISQQAREEIEPFVGTRVYLELWVKVLKNWRRDENVLRRLGYRIPRDTRK